MQPMARGPAAVSPWGGERREADGRVPPVGGDGVLRLREREMQTAITVAVANGGMERVLDGVFSLRFGFWLWPDVA